MEAPSNPGIQGSRASSGEPAQRERPIPRNPRQPLLYAALAFGAGIVAGTYCWRPPSWWLVSALVFSAGACYFLRHRPRAAPLMAIAVWLCLGAVSIQVRHNPPLPDIARLANRTEVLVTAHVVHEGYLREAGFGGVRQSLDVETEKVQTTSESSEIKFRIRLGIFGKESVDGAAIEGTADFPIYHYGQRLRFTAKLRQPYNYGNPGSFDYRAYLEDQGVTALGSAKAETVEVLPGFSGSWLESVRSRMHRRIIEKIHSLWPPSQAALMDAAVIGEDAFINRSTRVDFQRSGTYHILVVSGMNVSILAFVIFWTLRRLGASEMPASILTILLAVSYAFLTDVGPPVWRATLMMTCYLATRAVYRDRSMLNALGAAALGIMMVDPKSFLGASFQLTFLSVLILAALAIPLLERTSQPYRRSLRHLGTVELDPSLEPRLAQFRVDLRMIARRLARFAPARILVKLLVSGCALTLAVYDILLVSALMQVGLALPMAWYFHRATVLGLPANALAVPLTEVLMPAAVMALGLGFVMPLVAKFPAMLAGFALQGITATVRVLGGFQIADLRVPLPPFWLVIAASGALILSMILARRRFLLVCAGIIGVVVTAICIALVPATPNIRHGVLEVTAIDVGQGDSTLIVSPQGRTLLIDAGGIPGSGRSNFDIGEDVVSPYLWSRGLSRLDVAVVTHGHWDHVGGMHAVLANFRPRELWVGMNAPTPALAFLLAYASEHHIVVRKLGEGDQFPYYGTTIRVLAPIKEAERRRANDDCLALKFLFDGASLLMVGDAEKFTERRIIQEEPAAELLKVGHHGSATSTSEELLTAVHPKVAVISVGRDNSYGHPRREVLQRLENAGVTVFRTDLNGYVTLYMDGRSVSPVLH